MVRWRGTLCLLVTLCLLLSPTIGHTQSGSSTDLSADAIAVVIIAPTDVIVSSELTARIASMPYDEGDRFDKGDVIVAFDCEQYRAQALAGEAAYRAKQKIYQTNVELNRFEAIGKSELTTSRALAKQAAATARSLKVRTEQCLIKAPFSGVVVERMIQPFELADTATKLMRIIDDRKLALDLIVPSKWLQWLAVGTRFRVEVEETGESYFAGVVRIGAVVDAISHTVKIRGEFTTHPSQVRPGMSGYALFEPPK